jgi:hypothetical protein
MQGNVDFDAGARKNGARFAVKLLIHAEGLAKRNSGTGP